MKFSKYVVEQFKIMLSSSLALGLVLGALLLTIGKVEGSVSLDIGLSTSDSLWFFLGVPLAITALFLILCPLSFLMHRLIWRG